MKRRVYIYVNGILTFPGQADNWNRRAVTWTHLHTGHVAESLEYLAGPVSRIFGQSERAEKLIRKIEFYDRAGFEVHLVGHSNGADVIRDALSLMPAIRARVVLISAAIPADMRRNGLEELLVFGVIDHLTLLVAGNDWALRLGGLLTGRALGYGRLGLDGPQWPEQNPGVISDQCRVIQEPDFGHGSWFCEDQFDRTMRRIHSFSDTDTSHAR